jgi:cyclophilin family peptidyl-prolyl cis-trans isomerase
MGDIMNNDGSGHVSHHMNSKYIKDEIKDDIQFIEAGVVALANKGPNTNGSQFFITLDELPYLNNKYTIIGQTIKGFDDLKQLSILCGNPNGETKCNAKISKTGIYEYNDYFKDKKIKF